MLRNMCSCLSAVIRGLLSQRAPERHSGSQLTFCQGVRRDRQRFVGEVEVGGGGAGGGAGDVGPTARTRFGRCAASRPQQMLVQTAETSVSLSESLVPLRCHLAPQPGSIQWQQILRAHAPRLHNVAGGGGGGIGDRLVDLCRTLCTRSALFIFRPRGARYTL